jgi:hypothetical protein
MSKPGSTTRSVAAKGTSKTSVTVEPDEAQLAAWVRRASQLPSERM